MDKKEIESVFNFLTEIKSELKSLPNLEINPHDIESLERGTEFLKTFNNDLNDFTKVADKIIRSLKNYFQLTPVGEPPEGGPHTPYGVFSSTKPYGFTLEGMSYKGLNSWKSLYLKVFEVLKKVHIEKYERLPYEKQFISNRGRPLFSTDRNIFCRAGNVNNDFYTEVNLSANSLCKNIIHILKYFDIDPLTMKIYLRKSKNS